VQQVLPVQAGRRWWLPQQGAAGQASRLMLPTPATPPTSKQMPTTRGSSAAFCSAEHSCGTLVPGEKRDCNESGMSPDSCTGGGGQRCGRSGALARVRVGSVTARMQRCTCSNAVHQWEWQQCQGHQRNRLPHTVPACGTAMSSSTWSSAACRQPPFTPPTAPLTPPPHTHTP
jgi:hypothetical protein